jgi:hypothetical protein
MDYAAQRGAQRVIVEKGDAARLMYSVPRSL